MIRNLDALLQAAAGVETRRALVVYPANDETFAAIREARANLHLQFLLVGDGKTIEAALPDRAGTEIVDRPGVEDALAASVELLGKGNADILMKGSLDTATLIKAALRPESSLRTGRLLSDVFLFEYHSSRENQLVMITDGGLNIAPDLAAKVQLIRNAVEVAHALGNANPKVAVLAASELVQPNMPATVDAAELSRMNEQGEI